MAKPKTKLLVTQPYHGVDGELLFEPGHLFDPGEELPDNIAVTEVEAVEAPEPGWHPMEYPADDPGLVIPVSDHGSGDYWPTVTPGTQQEPAKAEPEPEQEEPVKEPEPAKAEEPKPAEPKQPAAEPRAEPAKAEAAAEAATHKPPATHPGGRRPGRPPQRGSR